MDDGNSDAKCFCGSSIDLWNRCSQETRPETVVNEKDAREEEGSAEEKAAVAGCGVGIAAFENRDDPYHFSCVIYHGVLNLPVYGGFHETSRERRIPGDFLQTG